MHTPPDKIDTRRKRLLWRATHRGIKEMDILLGGYASAHLSQMSAAELDALEAIIGIPDQQLLAWATDQETVPPDQASPMLSAILTYRP